MWLRTSPPSIQQGKQTSERKTRTKSWAQPLMCTRERVPTHPREGRRGFLVKQGLGGEGGSPALIAEALEARGEGLNVTGGQGSKGLRRAFGQGVLLPTLGPTFEGPRPRQKQPRPEPGSAGGLEHQQRDRLRLTGQAQQVDVEGEVRCWGRLPHEWHDGSSPELEMQKEGRCGDRAHLWGLSDTWAV